MMLFIVLRTYFKDVKEIGKDNLAVPLGERLCCYFAMIGIPVGSLIVYILLHSIL